MLQWLLELNMFRKIKYVSVALTVYRKWIKGSHTRSSGNGKRLFDARPMTRTAACLTIWSQRNRPRRICLKPKIFSSSKTVIYYLPHKPNQDCPKQPFSMYTQQLHERRHGVLNTGKLTICSTVHSTNKKKTSTPRKAPIIGGFPSQRASNMESVSMS